MADHGPATTTNVGDISVPVSRGFPLVVRLALLAGVAIIILLMGLTVGSSSIGHAWPWTKAMSIPLNR